MPAKYLTVHVHINNSDAPFIRCAVRLSPEMLSSIIIGMVLRKNAIEQHAPSFKYEDTDITAIKTKGGEVLPLDILQDNIGDLEHLFGEGEKWHIIVHIRSSSESNSMQHEEKVPMHTNNQGASAGATCNPTPIGKLKLFVKSQTGETTEFIVKKTMKMEKLFTPLRR